MSVLLGVTVLLGTVSLIFPFGRDQGIFAYIGESVLRGQVMYRDILMGVLPMPPLAYALGIWLFGPSMLAVRILDLLWTAATGVCLFLFVRRATGRPWAGALAGCLYAFLYYLVDYWNTAQPDGLLNLPIAAALALTVPKSAPTDDVAADHPEQRWAFAGLLVGVALLFKYTVAALLPGLILVLLVAHRRRPGVALRRIMALAAGTGIVLAASGLLLVVCRALPGFLEGQIRLAAPYSGLNGRPSLVPELLNRWPLLLSGAMGYPEQRIVVFSLPVWLAAMAMARWRRQSTRNGESAYLWVLVWLGSALLSVYVQGKFFRYHYLPLLAPAAVLAAIAVTPVLVWIRQRIVRSWLTVLLTLGLAALAVLVSPYRVRYGDLAAIVGGRLSIQDYQSSRRFDSGSDFSLGDVLAVSRYIRTHTSPSDHVLVWGLEPLINFLAQRRSTTRFVYNMPLTAVWSPPEYRVEFMRSYTRAPATILVVCHHDEIPWVLGHNKDSFTTLMEFTGFREFVGLHYQLEAQIGRFDVLRLVGPDD
jgi:hypothetical protein